MSRAAGTGETPVEIEARDLRMYFGDEPPAEGFDLVVDRLTARGGEMIGVCGRSGAGKSTLLHCLALLQDLPAAQRGRSLLRFRCSADAADVHQFGPEGRADIAPELLRNRSFGFVFQQHFLLPALSLEANMMLPLLLRGSDHAKSARDRAEHLRHEVELHDKDPMALPSELSGGQNQRVAVTRGLMHNAPFVFADEPTANLDPELRSHVLRMLRAHADDGNVVFLVSHELGDIARFCDRILVVHENRIHFPFVGDPDASPEESSDSQEPVESRSELPEPNPDTRARNDTEVDEVLAELEFVGDPDAAPGEVQEGPDSMQSTDLKESTNSRPELPAQDPGTRARADTEVDDVLAELKQYIWPDEQGSRKVRRFDGPEPQPGRPRVGGILGRYTRAELFGRRQRLVRVGMAMLLILVTWFGTMLLDYTNGRIAHMRDTELGPDEFVNVIRVQSTRPDGLFDPADAYRVDDGLAGLTDAVCVERTVITYFKSSELGDSEEIEIHGVDPDARMVQQFTGDGAVGLDYVHGTPLPSGDEDRAGLVISAEFARALRPEGGFPGVIEIGMPALDDCSFNVPGFGHRSGEKRARVKVPIVGVFRLPDAVTKWRSKGLRRPQLVFAPRGFVRRLCNKEYYKQFTPLARLDYMRVDDEPLHQPTELIERIHIDLPGAIRQEWVRDSRLRRAIREVFPRGARVVPGMCGDGKPNLTIQLTPATESCHWVTAEAFRADEDGWSFLGSEAAEVAGLAHANNGDLKDLPPLRLDVRPAAEIVRDPLPKWGQLRPRVQYAELRFAGHQHVMDAFLKLHTDAAYELQGKFHEIDKFQGARSTAGQTSTAVLIVVLCLLMGLIGIFTYLHVTGKQSDTGVLRAHGLSSWQVAFVYQAELTLMVLPACLVGAVAAFVSAVIADPFMTDQVLDAGKASFEIGKVAMATEGSSGAGNSDAGGVFLSQQMSAGELLLVLAIGLVAVALIVCAMSRLAVRLVRGKPIVELLAGR